MSSSPTLRLSLRIVLIEWPILFCSVQCWKTRFNRVVSKLHRSLITLKKEYAFLKKEYESESENPHHTTCAVIIRELSPDAFGEEYDWL
jgi:hypothetical protein